MSSRQRLFQLYFRIQRLLAPRLKYSQALYEETLEQACRRECDWLDLGCGHNLLPPWRGEAEARLVAQCRKVVGLDFDMPSLRRHRTIHDRVRGDISRLPFADDTFDLITSNMVFEHLAEPDRQLAEINRVLKPGGQLIFHTPNLWGYTTVASRLIPEGMKDHVVRVLEGRAEEDIFPVHYRINSRKRIESLARETGFEVEKVRLIVSSAQFAVIPPLAALELLWIRLLMLRPFAALRTNIIAQLRKPTPSTATAHAG